MGGGRQPAASKTVGQNTTPYHTPLPCGAANLLHGVGAEDGACNLPTLPPHRCMSLVGGAPPPPPTGSVQSRRAPHPLVIACQAHEIRENIPLN